LLTGKPFVVQLWGSDAELARRRPWAFRWLVRRARLALCVSRELEATATELGARKCVPVSNGVSIPEQVREPDEPPHVLYVGRLSEEKGVLELVEACGDDVPLVVVGDGPLRAAVPNAVGFVSPTELGDWYKRAAIVACPSRREGYGVVAREAMAWARPVVASAVGGLRDAVDDGATGLLVHSGDVTSLRAALEQLRSDTHLRARLGAAARAKAERQFSFAAAAEALLDLWQHAATIAS
jgi:glycosyltransferase involved in cell wall biosynthesis